MPEAQQQPAPPPPVPPFYRVVEVRANLSERTLKDFPYILNNFADEQAKRAESATYGRMRRDTDGLRIRIYSSADDGTIDLQKDLSADSNFNV